MKSRWFAIIALGGWIASASAAEVQLYGVHIPGTGDWAVYARISNPASSAPQTGRTTVAGISSINVYINNNSTTIESTTHTSSINAGSAVNALPGGTTNIVDANLGALGYGFWMARKNNIDIVYSPSGVSVGDSQYTMFDTAENAARQPYVIQGTGLTGGSKAIGGALTSATSWTAPMLVAKGKFTASSQVNSPGLSIGFVTTPTNSGVNLLMDMDASAAVNWTGGGNVEQGLTQVVDARVVVGTTVPVGAPKNVTVRTGFGDANLNGLVNFDDLVVLAQHYEGPGTWFDGDFTFDGMVNFDDLVLIAQNYETAVPGAIAGSAVFEADVARAFASVSVPEPSSVICAISAIFLLTNRRRRR